MEIIKFDKDIIIKRQTNVITNLQNIINKLSEDDVCNYKQKITEPAKNKLLNNDITDNFTESTKNKLP